MSVVFDLIILAVCVISIVLGAKRGFIKSVMGVCTLIAALCLAYAFTPVVSDSIRSTDAMKNVSESIGDTIKSLSHTDEGGYDLEKMFSDMPDAFRGMPATLVYIGILALALMGFTSDFSLI